MKQKFICFGDSNTYGAHGFTGGQFPKNIRWTGILSENPEWDVVNYGENGREIPADRWDLADLDGILTREAPFSLFIIMLGTNDLLTMYRSGMDKIAKRMEDMLLHIMQHPAIAGNPKRILLIAPPPVQLGRFGMAEERYDQISQEFGSAYSQLAKRTGTRFADVGKWQIELGSDGVHFTEKGHRIFAENMSRTLNNILL